MNKKIIASVLAIFFAFSIVGGNLVAEADTIEDLQAQIAQLLAMITSLQAQIAGQTTPVTTGLCISGDLSLGMTSAEVTTLQQGLKQDISVYPEGLTTGYFGPLTKAAVIRFQNKYASEILASWGLTKGTGYAGSTTRAKFNALYCTPVAPTTTTTVAPVIPEVTTTTTVAVVATEGSVTVTYDPIVINSTSVYRGEDKAVMGIKVKATGSDMTVTRLWLDINTRIWLSADSVSLLDGSTVLATLPLSASTVTEITASSVYRLEFNGLSFIVPIGTTKVLTVKVNRPLATTADADVTVATTSSLRAVDAAGISESYALATRTWVFAATVASEGTLTATLNAGSPAIQSVSDISATVGVLTPVKLMDFDLKATSGAINVTALSATTTLDAGTCTLAGSVCFASAELRDGTTVLDSVAGSATLVFDELNIDIAADTTKTLSIWVQMNPMSTDPLAGAGIHAVVNSVTATTGTSFTSATISPTVTGNVQYLFQYAPAIALGLTSAIQADESTSTTVYKGGNYSIAFTMTAPSGSDICVDRSVAMINVNTFNGGVATSGVSKINTTSDIGGTLAPASTVSGVSSLCNGSGAEAYDKVAAGTTRTFTITGYIPHGTLAGYNGMHIDGISWTSTNTSAGLRIQNWGLSDFKTAVTYLTI